MFSRLDSHMFVMLFVHLWKINALPFLLKRLVKWCIWLRILNGIPIIFIQVLKNSHIITHFLLYGLVHVMSHFNFAALAGLSLILISGK